VVWSGGSVGSGTPYVDTTTGNAGKYALGQVTRSWTHNSETGADASSTPINPSETAYTYVWHDGAVQTRTQYYADVHARGTNDIDDTQFTLDTHGTVKTADIDDGQPRIVTYVTDTSGQVVVRSVAAVGHDPKEIRYRYGGKEMGVVTNDAGPQDMVYRTSISDRQNNQSPNDGAFRFGYDSGTSRSEFDHSYQGINSYNQGSVAGSYTVRGGESLSSIAASVYGDSSLWYKIAQANGLRSADASLTTGQTLSLPAGVTRNTYNAGTFQPYNPGEAIGDTSPTAPEPPKEAGKNCGMFGQAIVAVVASTYSLIKTILTLNIARNGRLYHFPAT